MNSQELAGIDPFIHRSRGAVWGCGWEGDEQKRVGGIRVPWVPQAPELASGMGSRPSGG